jgi:hypothetical protein
VPPQLDLIVMRALARSRDDRYQSAKDMQDDLANFMLPETPDKVRVRLAKFMAEAFADEIAEERKRLEEGSQVAEKLRKNAPSPDAWEGSTSSTMSQPGVAPGRNLVPIALFVLVALFGLVGVGLAAAVGGVAFMAEPEKVIIERDAPKPTTGAITFAVAQGGTVFLNGEKKGESGVTVHNLAPATYTVRVELADYEPLEEKVTVVAGQTVIFNRSLKAIPKPEVAKAPTTGSRPKAKASTGAAPTTTAAAPPPAATGGEGKGSITVTTPDGTLCDVFANGKKVGSTGRKIELEPGTYEIRAKNTVVGIDYAQSVTIVSGQAERLRVKLE